MLMRAVGQLGILFLARLGPLGLDEETCMRYRTCKIHLRRIVYISAEDAGLSSADAQPCRDNVRFDLYGRLGSCEHSMDVERKMAEAKTYVVNTMFSAKASSTI